AVSRRERSSGHRCHRLTPSSVYESRSSGRESSTMAATDWDGEAFTALTTAVRAALEHLAPTERAVFLLREVFEFDFDEIATSVGITEANAREILTRA